MKAVIFLILAVAAQAQAGSRLANQRGQLDQLHRSRIARIPAAIPEKQIKLDLEKVQPIEFSKSDIDQKTMNLVMPTNMEATSDTDQVSEKILDHNMQNLVQGRFIRNAELMQTAQKVQQALQPKVSFGEPGGVQHSFNMELLAFSRQAKLKYEGYLTSDVLYDADTQNIEVSLYEQVAANTRLELEHKSDQDVSLLKVNWDW